MVEEYSANKEESPERELAATAYVYKATPLVRLGRTKASCPTQNQNPMML